MNKTFIVFMIFCLLAVATFADMPHHHHHHHHQSRDIPKGHGPDGHHHHDPHHGISQAMKMFKDKEKINDKDIYPITKVLINPGVTIIENVSIVPKVFEVSIKEGDALAVQIVHVSDMYYCDKDKTPIISVTRVTSDRSNYRVNEKNGHSLSFTVSASEVALFSKGSKDDLTYSFSLDTMRTPQSGGARAGLLVCVGPEASLETCVSPSTLNCSSQGTPSSLMNVCICNRGLYGDTCENYSSNNPNFNNGYDSAAHEEDIVKAFFVIFFFTLCGLVSCIAFICCCLVVCACCAHKSITKKGRVVNPSQPAVSVMTTPYAYRPVGVSAAPPPPPPPPPTQVGKAIEMTTLPASSSVNPVFVMPPLAPVRQVPVFVKPSPKN